MKETVVFLDRDGVLIRACVRRGRPHPPSSLAEVEFLPGVLKAVGRLREAGLRLVVVTNQPDVARGVQTRDVVEAINDRIQEQSGICEFRVCYHDDAHGCACRKPKPGLLLQDSAEVDLPRSFMVGDRWRDIEAGRQAGCRTVFIDHGYSEHRPDKVDLVARSLMDAADWILAQRTAL